MAVMKQTIMDLSTQIASLAEQQEKTGNKIDRALYEYGERLRHVESEQATAKEQRRQHEAEISKVEDKVDRLSMRETWWGGINTLAALIAGLLGLSR